jgi:hypothetical protein
MASQGGYKLELRMQEGCKEVEHKLEEHKLEEHKLEVEHKKEVKEVHMQEGKEVRMLEDRKLEVSSLEVERMQEVKEGSPSAQERERRPVSALLPQREWDFRDFREVWLHLHRRRLSSS